MKIQKEEKEEAMRELAVVGDKAGVILKSWIWLVEIVNGITSGTDSSALAGYIKQH